MLSSARLQIATTLIFAALYYGGCPIYIYEGRTDQLRLMAPQERFEAFLGLYLLATLGVQWFAGWWDRGTAIRELNKHMVKFTAPVDRRAHEEPYLRGKLLPIDVSRRAVDVALYKKIPDLRANSVSEIGMALWLKRENIQIGTYDDGTGAYLRVWRLSLIDASTWSLIAEAEFRGGDPPTAKSSEGMSGFGMSPELDAISYLRKLRRIN